MKFGKYIKSKIIHEWQYYYVDYKNLKKVIKHEKDSHLFYEIIQLEFNKLNFFIHLIEKNKNKPLFSNENISNFLVINYMALFKAVKKHDKQLSKTTKINFFYRIKEEPFYKYYLKLPRISDKIKLVIFDKDGTLIRIDKIFGKWLVKLIDNFEDVIQDKNSIYEYLGYDISQNKFNFDSVVAKGTNDDLKNSIVKYIRKNTNINIDNIKTIIKQKWIYPEIEKPDIIQCGNIKYILKTLKNNNIKVAICTSDDRDITEKTIEMLNIGDYIDSLKCGDDPISSKPSPEPIWKICSDLNVDVKNTIMIGDTISDIHAGINAKCGKVIGVLSGGYNNTDLNNADNVINSIDNLFDLLQNNELI